MQPNEQGRYLIEPLEVELGLWSGTYQNQAQWLRWWDTSGNMLLIGSEHAETERERAEIGFDMRSSLRIRKCPIRSQTL